MMEKQYLAEDLCIRLLKSELWDAPVEIPDSFTDWGMVVRIAKKQSVLGIVGNRMLAVSSTTTNDLGKDNIFYFLRGSEPKIK